MRLSGGWRLLKFALLFLIALSALLAIAGATYEAIASARDRRLYPTPGKLVDIGGRRLHIYCTGQGSPTVILDAGLGDPSLYWFLVQPEITKFTRVCSYDRAGLGWSDPSPAARTAHQIASDLDALLTPTVPPPYVLVGHSGGVFFHGSTLPNTRPKSSGLSSSIPPTSTKRSTSVSGHWTRKMRRMTTVRGDERSP